MTKLSMQTSDLLRHQLIKSLTTQRHEKGTEAEVDLWTQMAAQLILIIGAGGFYSLYARSVLLSQSTAPWLAARSEPPQADHWFDDLRKSLQTQSPTLARDANCLLLITFTDILASMIGERLTTRILDSAWGVHAQVTPDKEVAND